MSRVRRWEGLVQESGELGAGGSTLGKVGGDDVEDGGRGGAGGVGGVMTSDDGAQRFQQGVGVRSEGGGRGGGGAGGARGGGAAWGAGGRWRSRMRLPRAWK